jgi:hypothetical protein
MFSYLCNTVHTCLVTLRDKTSIIKTIFGFLQSLKQTVTLCIDRTFAQNFIAPRLKKCPWCPIILLPVLTSCSAVPLTHETWVLGIISLLTQKHAQRLQISTTHPVMSCVSYLCEDQFKPLGNEA